MKFKDQAEYGDGSDAELSGREAYARYADAVGAMVKSLGGRVLFAGDVYLDRRTIAYLAEVRQGQETDRVQLANVSGLVVATRVGSSPDRHMTARAIKKYCGVADVPAVTPYELRHTAITHQADLGWSSFEIADWAGTSEQMISDRYRHRLRRVSRLRPGATA